MKFYKTLISIITLFIGFSVNGQSNDFIPLKCEGKIPPDFLELSSDKVKRDKKVISEKKLSRKEKSNMKDFSLSTNYSVDQILFSGQVLYGDLLTNYLNQLADTILANNKELRKQLRFYTLKSDVVNAYATNQGIIFVTVGLMAQVENEAQLAFLLCREIAHYTQKHNYQGFKKTKTLLKKNKNYSKNELDEKLKSLYNYSEEHEKEADKKGYQLFSKTRYSKSESTRSLEMLLYSYLPFEEIEWRPTYFEDSFYVFPSNLTLVDKKPEAEDAVQDDEDITSTNLNARKEKLSDLVDANEYATNLHLTKRGVFENFQKTSRIELAFIYIVNAKYGKAFYHAYLLEKKYQFNAFSNRIKAMSLYGIYKHKLAADNFEFENYDDQKGESKHVLYLFNSLSGREMNVLASREIWNYYLSNPNDEFIKTLAYETVSDVFKKAKMNRIYFNKTNQNKTKATEIVDEETKTPETKLEKIKKKQKDPTPKETDDSKHSNAYMANAYINLYKNPEFEKNIKQASYIKEVEEDLTVKNKKAKKKVIDLAKYDNIGNLDTLIIFNPNYIGPISKTGNRNFIKEEQKEIYLANIYKDMATKNKLNLSMLNILDKENLNTDFWNTYMLINQWLTERFNNDTVTMQLYFKEYVGILSEKYNTNYFALSGFRILREGGLRLKSEENDLAFFRVKDDPNLYYYMVIFDTQSGKIEFFEYKKFISKMRPEVIRGLVYKSFYNIKNTK